MKFKWVESGILLSMLIGAMFWMSKPAASQQQRVPRDTVIENLKQNFNEEPTAMGIAQDGISIVEVFTSPDGASWTIVVTGPDGNSYMVGAGSWWTNQKHTGTGPKEGPKAGEDS